MSTIKHCLAVMVFCILSTTSHADRMIAQGQHAQLTEDNALALLEATQFVFQQLGVEQLLENIDEQSAIKEIALAFPEASAQEQQVLSQARYYWNQAKTSWNTWPLQSKREFAYNVILLSVGSTAANQLLGGNPSANTVSRGRYHSNNDTIAGLPTIDSGYEGSSCWASAGCSGYDATTDSYTQESFDYGTGGYNEY